MSYQSYNNAQFDGLQTNQNYQSQQEYQQQQQAYQRQAKSVYTPGQGPIQNYQNFSTKIKPQYKPSYVDATYNESNLDYNKYTNSSTVPAVKSAPIEYINEKRYIFTSSRDRNRVVYPDPADFFVTLPDNANNIHSIELAAGTLPVIANVSNAPYILMQLENFNHIKGSNGVDYFGVLTLHLSNNSSFYHLDKSSTNKMPFKFTGINMKQDIRQFHIKLFYPDGTSVSFGDESNLSVPLDSSIQTSFTFELTCKVVKPIDLTSDYRSN